MKVISLSILVLAATSAEAQTTTVTSGKAAMKQCATLEKIDFANVQDAPTQVTQAQLIEAAGNSPAFCRVQGYIVPQVGFELRLPVSNWNGKFLEVGCGGFCGVLFS